jgi:predicted Rossmann-fold nucleotide-binding protein
VPSGTPADAVRSLGVPTWFYGHEPPNVFAEGIAKYFSNAVREDGLLARSNAGVLVMPGAAGTVQEIFQLATRLYYAGPDVTPPPLVLIGVDHWVDTLPVWPLLRALGQGRGMADRLHLVDDAQEAAAIVS